jgi:Metallo-peptidase family M12/Secretion system C-terminal sorting domain
MFEKILFFMKKASLFIFIILFNYKSNAQVLWQLLPPETKTYGVQYLHPSKYLVFQFNNLMFANLQKGIGLENESNMSTILLPNPKGGLEEFYLYECPMMQTALAIKYPTIKTYTAIHKSNTNITAKLDFTNYGFHAMIMNGNETYFIDPITNQNTGTYICYLKNDYAKPLNDRMHCELDETLEPNGIELQHQLDLQSATSNLQKTNGTVKREYRLALACTGEYAVAVAGSAPTKANVLSKMITSMNRVNGVYEKEFSVHLNLISNTDTLIYLDANTDNFSNNTSASLISENQIKANTIIGTANYDIGHVFSTGGGGLASLGCVCGTSKARGITGSSNPQGDPYDIDYVCHEIGHQFNGSHTFDAQTGSCSGNRSSSNAFEVGSGSTIMAYAGICDVNNLQNNSDDYFSIRSLNTISTFMNGNGNCSNNVTLANTAPTFPPILKTYYIPYLTFFEVDALATDAENDPISYCWEEYDRTSTGITWNTKTTKNPIFRSFNPTANKQRVFPQIENCITNTYAIIGQRVPDTNRIVKLKLCVRDMNNGYGSFNYSDDSITINTVKTTSLFRVTSQNNGPTYNGYDLATVTWNVAGTNTDPNIATSNVDIYVSVDGGLTYPYGAFGNVNNGSAVIGIPNVATTRARIKVKGANSIYFDLNDKDFTITNNNNIPTSIINSELNNIIISPNPTSNYIEFKNLPNNSDIKIINQIGQICLSQIANHNQIIQVSHLQKGIYVAIITDIKGLKIARKIIIE